MKDMQGSDRQTPLNLLGRKLRYFRETRQESVAEVSGAVEIDTELLERIESGEECPSEDILSLLINHFDLREQEAVQLWEWAGFNRSNDLRSDSMQELANRASIVLVALDARVMYTDNVQISADQNGVVLNFMQPGPHGQSMPVSRIGMSYEQAVKVVNDLQQSILRKQYLPGTPLLHSGEEDNA